MLDLTMLTIAEASRKMARKELSAVELTQAALERIERLNPQLNAFITVLAEQALGDLESLDLDEEAERLFLGENARRVFGL